MDDDYVDGSQGRLAAATEDMPGLDVAGRNAAAGGDSEAYCALASTPSQTVVDDAITLAEAGRLLHIDASRLRRLAAKGVLRARKVGRDWITTRRDVDAFASIDRRPGWPRGRPRGSISG